MKRANNDDEALEWLKVCSSSVNIMANNGIMGGEMIGRAVISELSLVVRTTEKKRGTQHSHTTVKKNLESSEKIICDSSSILAFFLFRLSSSRWTRFQLLYARTPKSYI